MLAKSCCCRFRCSSISARRADKKLRSDDERVGDGESRGVLLVGDGESRPGVTRLRGILLVDNALEYPSGVGEASRMERSAAEMERSLRR